MNREEYQEQFSEDVVAAPFGEAPFDLDKLAALPQEERILWGILSDAMGKYRERNAARKGVWRRSGLRGQTFHALSKAERAFEQVMAGRPVEDDHFHDQIIYAAFGQLLNYQNDLNGEWPWPERTDSSTATSTPDT